MKVIISFLLVVFGIFLGFLIRWSYFGFPLEQIKDLNSNYASILGFGTSLLTAIITLIYVIFTYRQAKASEKAVILSEQSAAYSQQAATANQKMVETMHQQLKQANHPCIVPNIISTQGTECFYKKRRQLHIELELRNIGNGPALATYAFSWLRLKYSKHHGEDLVPMYYLPEYIPSLGVNEKTECSLRFENHEIDALIVDLQKHHELNMDRIKNDPSRPAFRGTDLLVRIYYKNISNQWYEVTYLREIYCLEVKNNMAKSDAIEVNHNNVDEKQEKEPSVEKSKNDIKYYVPPKKMLSKDRFVLKLTSELFSVLDIKLVSQNEVFELLALYDDYLNNAVSIIGREE